MSATPEVSSSLNGQRKTKRHRVVYDLAAFDLTSGERLGRIKDISGLGFRLVGKRHLEPGTTYRLSLEIPHWRNGLKERVILDAECVWCHGVNEGGSSYFLTGFQVADNKPEGQSGLAIIQGGFLQVRTARK